MGEKDTKKIDTKKIDTQNLTLTLTLTPDAALIRPKQPPFTTQHDPIAVTTECAREEEGTGGERLGLGETAHPRRRASTKATTVLQGGTGRRLPKSSKKTQPSNSTIFTDMLTNNFQKGASGHKGATTTPLPPSAFSFVSTLPNNFKGG